MKKFTNTTANTTTANIDKKVKETTKMNGELLNSVMENAKRINELMVNLGLEIAPEERREPVDAKVLPTGWVSCKYGDLLNEIDYYPNGDAPVEGNVFARPDDTEVYWYCSNKPVGFFDANGKIVKIANNAFDRFKTTVANKWAMQRDWIPDYRYSPDGTNEENEAEVGLKVMECLMNGVDKSEITKACFDHLDFVYRAKPDTHKTYGREENCNDAERFMIATLFTGNVDTLHRLISDVDGHEIKLPTEEALVEFTEKDHAKFEAMKRLFAKVRERHELASEKCWLSAQCYALGMSTVDAIKFIWGEEAEGPKKWRRAEVKYSRMSKQVYNWLLDEIEEMDSDELDGLEKWVAVMEARQLEEIDKMFAAGLIENVDETDEADDANEE